MAKKKKQSNYWTMRCPERWHPPGSSLCREKKKNENKIACNSPSIFLFLEQVMLWMWGNNLSHPRSSSPCPKRARVEQVFIPSPGNCLCWTWEVPCLEMTPLCPPHNGIPGLGKIPSQEFSWEEHSSPMWNMYHVKSVSLWWPWRAWAHHPTHSAPLGFRGYGHMDRRL